MIKALIFDFDGTLADTIPYTFEKIIDIAQKYNFKENHQTLIKKISQLTPKQLIKEFKISWLKIPAVLWEIRKAQASLYQRIDKIKIFPHLKVVLKKLKKEGFSLYIYSSNIKKNIDRFLEKENIKYLFKEVYTGSNLLGKDKDLKNILKREGLKKEEVIYVADEVRDILACKKANIKMIGVSWGLAGREGLKNAGVNFLVKKPEEILKIVNNIKIKS